MSFKKKIPPITEIKLRTTPKKGEEAILEVTGYLSDSGWKLLPESVSINEEDHSVEIKIPASRETKLLATQVITYFTLEYTLVFNSVGKWVIKCNKKSIEIEVEE